MPKDMFVPNLTTVVGSYVYRVFMYYSLFCMSISHFIFYLHSHETRFKYMHVVATLSVL